MRHLPESVIIETTEYKILQSQFSVLYNESMQINTMLDEARSQLAKNRIEYQRYIEVLESNELEEQKKLRNDLLQKQYVLDQTRKEFEILRNKYEQNLAANEQTAPINREMRQLITTLQTRNGQIKKDNQRYKRKYKEITADNTKLTKDLEEMSAKLNEAGIKQEKDIKNESTASATEDEPLDSKIALKEESIDKIKSEQDENDSENDDKSSLTPTDKVSADGIKKEDTPSGSNSVTNAAKLDRENRDLKVQLKKALSDLKDTKVVMDTYKGVSKEQRDKVQLMAAEKKVRAELEDMKAQIKKMQETKREDRKKLADEDVLRKMKQLEEKNCELQKQVTAQKVCDGQWVSGYRPFVGSNVRHSMCLSQINASRDDNFPLLS